MKESNIQSDTITLLAMYGYLAKPVEFRGSRGCPDLFVFKLHRPQTVAWIELKTKKGRRSPHQIQTAELFAIWGHEVGVCRTPDEALAHVEKVFNGSETKTLWNYTPPCRETNGNRNGHPILPADSTNRTKAKKAIRPKRVRKN